MAFYAEIKYIIIFPGMLFLTTYYRVQGLTITTFSLNSLDIPCYSVSYSRASLILVSFIWLVIGNHINVMEYGLK